MPPILPSVDEAVISLKGNTGFVLPHAAADTAAKMKANVDYVYGLLNQDQPGHTTFIGLETMPNSSKLFIMAMLKAISSSQA